MKNTINFKSILLNTLCVAGTLFLLSSCTDSNTIDSKKIAQQENISKLTADEKTITVVNNDKDSKFLIKASEMQLELISLGRLAQQKGNSPHVLALGKMMEEDHNKSLTELKVLAKSKSISIPSSITKDSKSVYDKLNEKTGNDFGKAYSNRMVDQHKDAIKLYEKISTDSEDPKVRIWASNQLPGLKSHLKHAEASKKEFDKTKS